MVGLLPHGRTHWATTEVSYYDLVVNALATVSYVKNPMADAGIALKSLRVNPLYSPCITRPPDSSIRSFVVA